MTDRETTPDPDLTTSVNELDENELIEESKDDFFPESLEEVLPQAEPTDGTAPLP